MKQKLSARRDPCKSPLLKLDHPRPELGQALAILRKNKLSIECEPKRLGSLRPQLLGLRSKGVGSRGFGLSRYAQSVCQQRVNVSEHIKTHQNIFLSGSAKQYFIFVR